MGTGMTTGAGGAPGSGTVHRVLRILSLLSERESWGLNELARQLGLPRATTHRLLALCRQAGFADQNAEGLYTPGMELYRLAGKLSSGDRINRVAAPILRRLRDATDETLMLTLLMRKELKMFFSWSESPDHPLRYTIERHLLQPLSWGASGLTLLAFLDEEEIAEVLRRAEPSPLDGRPLQPELVRQQIERIRRDGHGLSHGQRAPEAHGISVPFFDADGEVRGNLTLTIPDHRIGLHDQARLIDLLKEATAELRARLGWA